MLRRPVQSHAQHAKSKRSVRVFIQRNDNHTFSLFFLALRYASTFALALLFTSESCWLTQHAHHPVSRVCTCINRALPIVPSFPPLSSSPPHLAEQPSAGVCPLPLLRTLNRENYQVPML